MIAPSNAVKMKLEETKSRPEPVIANREKAGEFNKKGLFIGGAPKSGTSLLMSLLDNHPQLIVLPEETFYLEDRHKFLALNGYEARLSWLLEKTNLRFLAMGRFEPKDGGSTDARDYSGFDYPRFASLAKSLVQQPGMNDSLLFSETVRAYGIVLGADWQHCVRWIEKSTSNEVRAEALDELFPEAKVIQVVRDPRAVFTSRKSRLVKNSQRYSKAHRFVREWNRSTQEISRLRRDPSRFLIIRYEDLVKNPRDIMEKVCRFGGFDFNEKILEPTRAGSGWEGNSAFHEAFKGISSASLDLWKNRLSEDEIWWIELHCRKGMELANYPFQTNARFSLVRWFKRLPDESWSGYLRARRASLCQGLGLLKECRYNR
jgi:hypothetical protein